MTWQQEQHEAEANTFRLFGEKQFGVASVTLLVLAMLMSLQFMLLPMAAPKPNQTGAPPPEVRVDVSCSSGGELLMLDGATASVDDLQGAVVVVHLDPSMNECVADAVDAGVDRVVLGVAP